MCKYLVEIIKKVHQKLVDEEVEPKDWLLSDETFEKMGEIMPQNDGKMVGLYDELTNWLSQVNLYSGTKGLLDTHEFTKLLEFFSAISWSQHYCYFQFLFAIANWRCHDIVFLFLGQLPA